MSEASIEARPRFRFLHIPKTAGGVTNEAIQRIYPHDRSYRFPSPNAWMAFRGDLSDYDCVLGHAGFDASRYVLGSRPMTVASIFRDPVDRVLSNYFFHRSFGPTVGVHDCMTKGDDAIRNLEEILDHPNTPLFGLHNFQTAMMTRIDLLPLEDFAPPLSLDAMDPIEMSDAQQAAVFDAAMEHLSQVDIVGLYEDLPTFYARISAVIGYEIAVPSYRYHVSAKEEHLPDSHPLRARIRQKVADVNAWDLKLYEAARRKAA
mgnify:CR=1 FL=1